MAPEGDEKEVVWVMVDAPSGADVARYAGPLQMDPDKLKEHFQKFTSAIGKALQGAETLAGGFELSEVTLSAKLTAEIGFVLVGKTEVEGGVEFKFEKRKVNAAGSPASAPGQ